MPSNPWEKLPGSNSTVVSPPDLLLKPARRHEWPKCVNCMFIFCAQGVDPNATDAGGGHGYLRDGDRIDFCQLGARGSRRLPAQLRPHPRFGVDRADERPAL